MLKLANIASYNAFVALAVQHNNGNNSSLPPKPARAVSVRKSKLDDMEDVEIINKPSKKSIEESDVENKEVPE